MIDLGLNQNKIKEIKYEIKEGKTVIFKLNNCNLEDVAIETNDEKIEQSEEPDYHSLSESEDYKRDGKKQDDVFTLDNLNKYGPAKHLDDYKPVSIFRGEDGMQETLEASRHKNWRESFKENPPQKPTPTGNALIPVDCLNASEKKKHPLCATKKELMDFYNVQKVKDFNTETEYKERVEKKLAKELFNAKKLMSKFIEGLPDEEKKNFLKRVQNNYFKNDEELIDTIEKICKMEGVNYKPLDDDEKKTLKVSSEKDWKESVKEEPLFAHKFINLNLDNKYKDLSREEKREITKQLIENDAKNDAKVIKERIEKSIGSNEPLSEEVLKFPQRNADEVVFKQKTLKNRDREGLDKIVKAFKQED